MACQALPASAVNGDTERELSPLSGRPIKKHEKWGLKGINKDQHAGFWEQAVYWCKERFSEAKWKEVVRRIERAAKEDNIIMFGWHPSQRCVDPVTVTIDRRRLLRSPSLLTSSTGTNSLCPPHLRRISSSTPTTARPRWDILNFGPATPLSVTSSIKNAFAEGGVWASLSPKTPVSAASVSSTPITAVPVEPWTPEPPRDTEAKAAFNEIRSEIKQTALRVCAHRLGLRPSSGGQDVIHPSMVKLKDSIVAAEMTLDSLELDLSQDLDTTLSTRIEQFADDEATYLRQYSITTAEKLSDIDSWLQIDETTGEITTILEAQRDLLRLNRKLRKDQDLSMCDTAVQCAWAVKILNDLEYIVDSRADADSADSDEGYSYENFLRSIRSESNLSEASAGSAVSSSSDARARTCGKQSRARHSSSPIRRTISSLPPTATPSPAHRPYPRRRTLSINTSSSNLVAPAELSPEERFYRHLGSSMADLDSWTDELNNMKRKRAGIMLESALRPRVTSGTPVLRSSGSGRRRGGKRMSGDSMVPWRCETAELTSSTGDVMLRRFLDEHNGDDDEGEEVMTPPLDTGPGTFPRLDPPSHPPYLVQQDGEEIRARLLNGYDLRAALRLEPPSRPSYVLQRNGEEEVTTPRLDNTSHASLRLDPPSRPPYLVQRNSDSVPRQAALEYRNARRQVNRAASLEQCVTRQREAGEVQEWVRELERMESREKLRQMGRFL